VGQPLRESLRAAINEVTGTPPSPYTGHYAGDIRYPIRLSGVPAFGIGSVAGGFYGPDEWVDLDDLVRLTAVVALVSERWA
jgi:acetylornithine deacetylase/succinyl-diaminopimelate desuccinylase-like protein